MKKMQAITIVLALLLTTMGVCQVAVSSPVGPFSTKAWSEMGAVTEVGQLITSPYNFNNTFTGTISSSVWQLAGGDYLYLYQATNAGPSSFELLGVAPFYEITGVGAITSGAPAGYLAGGYLPLEFPAGSGNYSVTYSAAGANVTFGYLEFMGGEMPAGQHTGLLYLISPNAPVTGNVYAMDGGIASATGWTNSVPEPASLTVLGLGAAMLLKRRRRA